MELDATSRESVLQSANALLLKTKHPTSFEQLVLSAFNCDSAESLGRRLGVTVTSKLLGLALAGRSTNAVPAPLHLAVLAVATARLEDEGFMDERGELRVDLPTADLGTPNEPDLPADTLEELMALATDYNISRVAVMAWLSGESWSSIERKSLATVGRLKGFYRSLPEHLAICLPRPHPSPAKIALRGATQEERRSANRDHIRKMIDAGAHNRTRLLSSCSSSYKWALKFDRDWLDTLLPDCRRKKRG